MPNAFLVHEQLKPGDFATMKEKEINGVVFNGLGKLTMEELTELKAQTIAQSDARAKFVDLIDQAIAKAKIIKMKRGQDD